MIDPRKAQVSNNNPNPLIVFVHVPKTGGTTINRVLKQCSYRGREHCESASEAEFEDVAQNGDWLSGHIPRDQFHLKLAGINRRLEYFSCVREPISQLISIINWYFVLRDRGHPESHNPIADNIYNINFYDLNSIKEFILGEGNIFCNIQTYLSVGTDYANISREEAIQRISSYSYVATDHDLPKLYRAFGFNDLPRNIDTLRENVSRKYFDCSTFYSYDMHDFFSQHLAYDFRLYNFVRNHSWQTQRRQPIRLQWVTYQIATPDNFVEQSYLDANADVADALRRGEFSSGRQHFDLHGCSEERLLVASQLHARVTHLSKFAHFLKTLLFLPFSKTPLFLKSITFIRSLADRL